MKNGHAYSGLFRRLMYTQNDPEDTILPPGGFLITHMRDPSLNLKEQ